MKALVLGCSHAAGSEMNDGNNKSYPMILAQKMGIDADNQSIPGGSNDAMFRIFEHYVDVKKIASTDIVIACWTGSWRTEVLHENQWMPIAGGYTPTNISEYIKQWTIYDDGDWKWRLNKIKNIIALNEIAIHIGVRVININSFNNMQGFDAMNLYTKYYWPIPETFCDWSITHQFLHTPNGHFFETAHEHFAEYLLQHAISYVRI